MLRHDGSPRMQPCAFLRLILQLARATRPEAARAPTTCCLPSVRACPRAPLLTRPHPLGAQILFALLGPAAAEGSFLSPGRRLSTSSCTFDPSQVFDFEEAVKADECDVIELESGAYDISATLVIHRTLTIQAKTPAPTGNAVSSVVLDAGEGNSFRVVDIGTNGITVSLIGLGITNGKAPNQDSVCPPRAFLGTDALRPIRT